MTSGSDDHVTAAQTPVSAPLEVRWEGKHDRGEADVNRVDRLRGALGAAKAQLALVGAGPAGQPERDRIQARIDSIQQELDELPVDRVTEIHR